MRTSRLVGLVVVAVVLGVPWVSVDVGASAAGTLPQVVRLRPHQGTTAGGTRVTVVGQRFSHVRWVKFGAARAQVVRVASSSRIVVRTPPHAPGVVDVRVRTAAGTSAGVKADQYRYLPAPVEVVVGDSLGSTFACARTTVGAARCWGQSSEGNLGNGADASSPTPVQVSGLTTGVRDLAAGTAAACAVTASRAAMCWGWELFGALGDGVVGNGHSNVPVQVVGLTSGVRSVSVGNAYGCAVLEAGTVSCWGNDTNGVLGADGPTGLNSGVPVTVAGLSGVASVATGNTFACALTTAGAVRCWGDDSVGQLGNGTTGGVTTTPVTVTGLSSGVTSLAAGGSTACAVTAAGAVQCWGSNLEGQLGIGKTDLQQRFSTVPVTVSGLASGQRSVSVGSGHSSCAVSVAGAVRCWGYNRNGYLGDGTEADSTVPVPVVGLSRGGAAESQSTYSGCALTTTARVRCWGYVPFGSGISDAPVSLPWFE